MWICQTCYDKFTSGKETFTDYNFLKVDCAICLKNVADHNLVNLLNDYELKQLVLDESINIYDVLRVFIACEIRDNMELLLTYKRT